MTVSDQEASTEFVRVKGNTTGSHLAGSKPNPYGELERFMVHVVPMVDAIQDCDLVKLDAEGHEIALEGIALNEQLGMVH